MTEFEIKVRAAILTMKTKLKKQASKTSSPVAVGLTPSPIYLKIETWYFFDFLAVYNLARSKGLKVAFGEKIVDEARIPGPECEP